MEVETFLSTFPEGKEFTEYLAEFYNLEIPSPFPLQNVQKYTRDDEYHKDCQYLAHIMRQKCLRNEPNSRRCSIARDGGMVVVVL